MLGHIKKIVHDPNRLWTLLLVTEEEQTDLLLEKLRQSEELHTEIVYDPEAMLDLAGLDHFDIVLIDMDIPGLNSSRIIRELKQIRSDQEFIVMTGDPNYEKVLMSIREGAMDFFIKPVDEMSITRILQTHRYRVFRSRFASKIDRFISIKHVELSIPTDVTLLSFTSNRLTEDIYHAGAIAPRQLYNLNLAIFEGLTNALEHGNLEISYEDKTRHIVDGNYMTRIRELCNDERFKNRMIHITYDINKDKVSISIRDEGDGFDVTNYLKKLDDRTNEDYHGRGIILIQKTMDEVTFNETGNEVTMSLFRKAT